MENCNDLNELLKVKEISFVEAPGKPISHSEYKLFKIPLFYIFYKVFYSNYCLSILLHYCTLCNA